jgi:hypothetical protein
MFMGHMLYKEKTPNTRAWNVALKIVSWTLTIFSALVIAIILMAALERQVGI